MKKTIRSKKAGYTVITFFDNKFEFSLKINADYSIIRKLICKLLVSNQNIYFLPSNKKQSVIIEYLKQKGYKVKLLKKPIFDNLIDIGIFKIDSVGNIHSIMEDLEYE